MDWRERTDVWFGMALLRPVPNTPNDQFGGAFIAFTVSATDLGSALKSVEDCMRESDWEVSSIERMKRAVDYEWGEEPPDGEVDYLDRVNSSDQHGLWIGSAHTFPKNAEKPT